MKSLIKGAIVLVIGGVAYSFSQADVARNMSKDTSMTEKQATQYIESIPENELASWSEVGEEYVLAGQELHQLATESDCNEWEFDWESPTLSCQQGLFQMTIFSNSMTSLGKSYISLDEDDATEIDMRKTINLISQFNSNFALEIIKSILTQAEILEETNTNSYNKAVLQSALDN